MLTRDVLLSFLHQGAKLKKMEGIGLEYEFFLMTQEHFAPLPFRVLQQIMETIRSQEVLSKEMLNEDHFLGLCFPDGSTISLEPGGQIEFTTPPLLSLTQLDRSVRTMYAMIEQAAKKHACMPLAIGFIPHWRDDDVFHIPKKRYDIMREYLPLEGKNYSEMMHRSCSFQINYDFHDEQDMIKKVRLILLLQPFLGALFTHSPLVENASYDNLSARRHFWLSTVSHTRQFLNIALQDSFGFDSYLTYLLETPTHMMSYKGEVFSVASATFQDYMNGQLQEVEGKYPSLKDFQYHMTTIFPDLRLKPFIEIRNLDSAPWSVMSSALAMLTGLLYDSLATEEALSVLGVTDAPTLERLTYQSITQGMDGVFQGQTFWQWARRLCHIAHNGLKRRARYYKDETPYLQVAMDAINNKIIPAQIIQRRYRSDPSKVFMQPFLSS